MKLHEGHWARAKLSSVKEPCFIRKPIASKEQQRDHTSKLYRNNSPVKLLVNSGRSEGKPFPRAPTNLFMVEYD